MNYKALVSVSVKFLPATNFKGSRVKITFDRPIKGRVLSITIPFDHAHGSAEEVAAEFLTREGFPPEASVDIDDRVLLLYSIDVFSGLRDLFYGGRPTRLWCE